MTIAAPAAANSLTVTDASSTIEDNSTLAIGTTLALSSGSFALASGGEVIGGTIAVGSNGDFQGSGGTLSGVSFHGTLDMTASYSALTLAGGTTFAGAAGSGTATINLSSNNGQGSTLTVLGTETLDDVTVNLGAPYTINTNGDGIFSFDATGNGATLTLGSKLVINQVDPGGGPGDNAFIGGTGNSNDAIVNDGTINAGLSGGYFRIYTNDFINNGTITVSNGDVLDLFGPITGALVDSIHNSAGGEIVLDGTLSNTGNDITVAAGGSLVIDSTITGGTITAVGSGVVANGGTLSGVSYQGTLNMTASFSTLTITGGTSFAGAGASGSATIDLSGNDFQSSTLWVLGTGTLTNATINLGAFRNNGSQDYIINEDATGNGATLTLGSSLIINQTGDFVKIESTNDAGDAIINDGTINAGYTPYDWQSIFTISANSFTNNGTISVFNGDLLNLTNLTNNGVITVYDGGIIDLNGTLSTVLIDSINESSGGVVQIDGTVTGGTITATSGGIGANGGTLSGVSYQGTLNMTASSSTLTITGGTSFAGAGDLGSATIDLSGNDFQSSTLWVLGTGTLTNATINLGAFRNNGSQDYIINEDATGNGATLTLGSSLIINQTGDFVEIESTNDAGDAIINDGTINAGYTPYDWQSIFTISANSFTNNGTISVFNGDLLNLTNLTNNGVITVYDGGIIDLNGTLSTALIDSINESSGGVVQIDGTVTGGTITATSGGIGANGGTLSGVSYQGTLNMTASFSTLTITGGTSFAGAGGLGSATIDLSGNDFQSSTLWVLGTGTLTNATINLGALRNNGSQDYIINEDATGNGATLTLGSSLIINQTGDFVDLTSSHYAGDATINDGVINAGYAPYDWQSIFTINADSFTNNGTISVYNSDNLSFGGTQFTNTGFLSIRSGGFVTIQNGLFSNTGSLVASDGGSSFSGGTFNNTGDVIVQQSASLSFQPTILTQLNGTTLTGGDFEVDGNATLTLSNNITIATDASTIILSGVGSTIQSYNTTTSADVAIDSTLQAIAAGGSLELLNGRDFTATAAGGTFTDAGTLLLGESDFTATQLVVRGGTLAGTGTISAPLVTSGIVSVTGPALVITGVLSGSGRLMLSANSGLTLEAGGTLTSAISDAGSLDLTGGALTATTLTVSATGTLFGNGSFSGTLLDAGLIDANGGTLSVLGLAGVSAGTWSGGALEADAGAVLQLANSATITADAGVITLNGTGSAIESLNASNAEVAIDSTLASIAAHGKLALLNGRVFNATANGGSFSSAGTILLAGGVFDATTLSLSAGAAVSGSGTIGGAIAIGGATVLSGGTLSLTSALSGAGSLNVLAGESVMLAVGGALTGTLTDSGTLALAGANLSSGRLSVAAGAAVIGFGTLTGTIAATGLLDANGGTLSIAGLNSLAGGKLSAGLLEADANSVLQLASNATITAINGGAVTLSGVGSAIQSLNTSTNQQVTIDATLDAIGAAGALALLNGQSFTQANGTVFTDAGVLNLNGGTFTTGTLDVAASGQFLDNGTFSGAISNLGTVAIENGIVLTATGGGTVGGIFTGPGTLSLSGAKAFTLSSTAVLSIGQLQVQQGASLSGYGTITAPLDDGGSVIAKGGTLLLEGTLTSSGTLTASAGATLQLKDGGTFFGTVNGAGIVENSDEVSGLASGVALSGTGTVGIYDSATGQFFAGDGDGAVLTGGAVLVNNDGSIGGSRHGLRLSGTSISVTNSGLITGDYGAAIIAASTGTVSIVNSGTLANYENPGVAAVSLNGAASSTLTNFGTIIGGYYVTSGGSAVQFGPGNDTYVAEPGSTVQGEVSGSGGSNTLDLAAFNATTGTISGLGTQFTSFETIAEAEGANWVLTGSNLITVNDALTLGGIASMSVAGTLTLLQGVAVGGPGTLAVQQAGLLEANTSGGSISIGTATVNNQGLLDVSGMSTLSLAGAALTNLAGGALTGGSFEVDGSATLLLPNNANLVTDNADIVLNGGTIGWLDSGATTLSTLGQTLGAIGAAGTLSLLGGTFSLAGSLADHGLLSMQNALLTDNALSISGAGTLSGSGTVSAPVTNLGLVEVSGGTLTLAGSVSGPGSLAINTDAVLIAAGTISVASLSFSGNDGTLDLAKPAAFSATLQDFGTSDTIDLLNAAVTGESFASNALTLTGASGTIATLHFAGNFAGYGFSVYSDGHGGSDIFLT